MGGDPRKQEREKESMEEENPLSGCTVEVAAPGNGVQYT